MRKLFLVPLFLLLSFIPPLDFKASQLKNARVKTAFLEKEKLLSELLKSKNILPDQLQIFLRVFKSEKLIEVWAKNKQDKNYLLLHNFSICASSGELGPKRSIGDGQVPEGFYFIERFNPASNFYLSLGLSYPNVSDRKLSKAKNLGGDIFIHGSCVTIGCMPITDDKIKELYALAVMAYSNGETKIPVHLFPMRLGDENLKILKSKNSSATQLIHFWENLKTGYDYFETKKQLPKISIKADGYYSFQ